jgi:hypothetical protein
MKEIKEYVGNVKIAKENVKEWEVKLKDVEKITGYLSIYSNADLKAPLLKSVGRDLYINSNADLKAPLLKSVGGDMSIYSNADLKALKSVGGHLAIYSNADLNFKHLIQTYGQKSKWYISDKSPHIILNADLKNVQYKINNVIFFKELFHKVRKDELTANEVFAIDNTEQRRVAYEKMDKVKMKALDNYKVLEEGKDRMGNKHAVISFDINGFNKPFLFYSCICPSTGREYFLQTDKETCLAAKVASFGHDEEIEYIDEF